MSGPYDDENWHDAPKMDAHQQVWNHVRRIDQEQGDVFDRLELLESLYDPYSPTGDSTTDTKQRLANMTENVVATNVDATYASVATAEVMPRFLTDGATWKMQRRAKKLEYYTEGLGEMLSVHKKCRLAFKESEKKGAGLVKVYGDRWDQPQVEKIRLQDVYVADEDSRDGAPPMQMHHVQRNYDREQLKAEYPEHKAAIEAIAGSRALAGYSSGSLTRRKITVIESIRLPLGKKPTGDKKRSAKGARYVPGRRTITIEGATLEDTPYHKPYYPVATLAWSDREGSFYPISGGERIAGTQNELNRRNWQINRILDQSAMVTVFTRPADAGLSVKTTKVGNTVAIKGDWPVAPIMPAVHPETYQSRRDLKESAAEQFRQSPAAARGELPAGLETGAAVREARSAATQPFSPQEADFEQLVLDVYFLLVDVCKDLGAAAPRVIDSRWKKPIDWSQVDMGDVRIQIEAASTLPRSPAGREQTLLEWAQAGIISTDSARRLIDSPDLDRELSMYTSALEVIDMEIEEILDGGIATPEPYDNLAMAQWRGNGAYNNARMAGAPEDVLEEMRHYMNYAAHILAQGKAQNENTAMTAGGPVPGLDPAAAMGAGPPAAAAPAPALAPESMQLMAS